MPLPPTSHLNTLLFSTSFLIVVPLRICSNFSPFFFVLYLYFIWCDFVYVHVWAVWNFFHSSLIRCRWQNFIVRACVCVCVLDIKIFEHTFMGVCLKSFFYQQPASTTISPIQNKHTYQHMCVHIYQHMCVYEHLWWYFSLMRAHRRGKCKVLKKFKTKTAPTYMHIQHTMS